MKSIRVGNDIVVRWRIYRYGKEYDVEQNKESISVILANMGEKKVITDYSVVDVNIIVFKFRAEDQGLGIYRLLLVDKTRNSTRVIEECNAFRIVSTANAADDEDTLESTVTITLTSELTAPADGLSAYEVALQNGFIGTEEEWLQSLLPDMTDIEQAEAQRQAKELERIASEAARESAESERQRASATSVASANDAAASANAAASAANKAAVNANNKASLADEATNWAQMQGDAALDASLSAEKQALVAKKAADNANAASENANTKAEEANNAAISANAAKETANAAAGNANDAAANAEQKATLATEAASSASTAAEAADTAAVRANDAADKFTTAVVQQQGTATDKVMSQKAVTDALIASDQKLSELESQAIYDVTANNNGATFASLSALLSSKNLSILIPSIVRCGGMNIRFVQSSENKYVQYRLMSDTFNTNPVNWQGVEEEPVAGSENLVKSGGVFNSIHRKAFFVEDDPVFSNFIEEVYLIEENLPENATDLHFVYNSPNLLFYWTIDGVSSYISAVTSSDGIWRIPSKDTTEPFGYVKINSNNIQTGYKISKNLNSTVYGLENSPSIAEAISVGSDFIPSIYINADYKFWHEIYKNIHLETVSFESTENYYFTIGVTDTDIYIAVHSKKSPNKQDTKIYKAVSVPKAQVTDTFSNVNIELLKSKTSITLNWLKILEAINKYNASASINGQITIVTQSESSIYPFYNCGMNINLLTGIKDIYIPNYDVTKHYFIERFCFSDTKTTYQLRIGYSDTGNAVSANQTTIIAQWFLTKSNYTDAQRKTTQLIQNNGVKVLINIQECIDGGLNFEYYGDTVNPFSAASVVRLCIDSYSSKIIQDDTKTKADNAITSVKTINNQSIEGTGNIVIEGGVSDWDDIQNKPTFAPVATSGSYSDLSDKPTITEGAIVIDNVLDPTSPNPLSNSGVATAVNARSIIVSTIEQLKAAFAAGYKRIILDTNGSYIELSEQLNIPDRVIISAYNGYIKRAIGYDKWLICMGKGSQIYGLTIDGNKDNVNKTPIDPAIPLWSQVEEIRTYTPLSGTFNSIGNIIKDCKIVNGNTGIMYIGWHNVVENCIFENMASAAVHYSAGYHSSVKGCTFKNCCLEASVYNHSEGAVLWSNFCEDSLVENNYFDGCSEFAIGGLDSADNNNIVIQNNRINNTKGIGSIIYGTNSHNVVIRNNFITNCVYNASESYGIYFKRSTAANPPTAVNNNYIIDGNIIWGGGMALYLRNSIIKNNAVINYSNAYNEPLKLVLDNCQINGNTFIEGNVTGYDFFIFTLRNCIFESNKISSPRRAFWLDGTERTIFRDNTIQCLEGMFYTNSSNNYGIELVNNVLCKGGVGSFVFAIPDGSKICGNTFLGRSDDSVPVLSVSSTSKNVVVKDNRYIGSLNFEGTGENGCYEDGNYELIGDSSQLLTKHLFSVNNLTYSIQYVTPVMVGQPVILKITPTSGYILPDTITVRYTKDGNTVTLTPGNIETYQGGTGDSLPWLITNDYLYDKETGYIYIPYVYDGLQIVASGVAEN